MSGGGRDADSTQEGRGPPWCGGKRQPCSAAPSYTTGTRQKAGVGKK